jgi:hypothetical protein
MAEDGACTAGENGRHPPSLQADTWVSHGIDALVKPVQLAPFHPPRDRVLPDPDRDELLGGDDAVLASRNASNLHVRRVAFFPHGWEKGDTYPRSPPRIATGSVANLIR